MRDVTLNQTRLMMGLSAIATGLEQIERGKTQMGVCGIREGLAFIRTLIREAECKSREAA